MSLLNAIDTPPPRFFPGLIYEIMSIFCPWIRSSFIWIWFFLNQVSVIIFKASSALLKRSINESIFFSKLRALDVATLSLLIFLFLPSSSGRLAGTKLPLPPQNIASSLTGGLQLLVFGMFGLGGGSKLPVPGSFRSLCSASLFSDISSSVDFDGVWKMYDFLTLLELDFSWALFASA